MCNCTSTGTAARELTDSAMGGSGHLCLPTSGHIGQSGGEVVGLPMQENYKASRKGRLFVYGRPSGSAGSAFCFPYNSVTVRRILFKFGRFRQ